MRDTTITLRNYRCFPESGASVTIGRGLTALVGPNNAGKTSFLRMLYETRPLWQASHVSTLEAWLRGQLQAINPLLELRDPGEVFSDQNSRGLAIDLEIAPAHSDEIARWRFGCDRATHHAWRCGPIDEAGHPQFRDPAGLSLKGSQLVNRGFAVGDIAALTETMPVLARSQYFGPFRNAIGQGAADYYDLKIGTAFVEEWNQWKTGDNKLANRVVGEVTDNLRRIFGFRRLEINAAADKKTLQVDVDGGHYKLAELGAGLAQFIVVFTNAALRRPSLILIDEPELSLHPSLQVDFLVSLAAYAEVGVVFATHSIGLARSVGDRIYSLRRSNGAVACRTFEQTPNYAEFVGEMSFSSFKELGCDAILLVEGVTDVKTVVQWLRLYGKEHRVVVLPLGGSQLIRPTTEMELAELKRISSRVSVLFDSERPNTGAASAEGREEFGDMCRQLGFRSCMTERRALENYLSDRAVKAEKGAQYSALEPFELLKQHQPGWGKSESWRIARHMTLEEIAESDVGRFLAEV